MGTDLVRLCQELMAIPSVSRHEKRIAGVVVDFLSAVPGLTVSRIGDNVVAQTLSARKSRVLIAGHLDTVPPDSNEIPEFKDGRLYGLGSSDMKSGLTVMLALAEISAGFDVDTTFVFYAREEIAAKFSGLRELESARPELLQGDAAILMEPTSAVVEAGCQGTMRVRFDLSGKRAHTARPWTGVNAIHRAGDLISRIATADLPTPVIDEVQFRESLQVVGVSGGVAGNVVPDLASVTVNYRFAPDKDVESAYSLVRSLFAGLVSEEKGDSMKLEEGVAGALPKLDNRYISKLVGITGEAPKAKLGWTDVAFFASKGIPAANFGPGDPLLAHTRDEYVNVDELDSAFKSMVRVLS